MTRDLLRSIYEACLEPERWPEAIGRIARAVGGHGGHLLLWDERRERPLFSRYVGLACPDADLLFEACDAAVDPWRRSATTRPLGKWLASHHLRDDRSAVRFEFYRDFMMSAAGCRHMAGARLAGEDGLQAMVAFGRRAGRRSRPYSEGDLHTLGELTSHLALAVRQQARNGRLEDQAALRDAALNYLSLAVIIVDRSAAIRYANGSGGATLKDPRGPFVFGSGRLLPRCAGEAANFQRAVRAAVDRGEGRALSLTSKRGSASNCVIVPLSPRLQLGDVPPRWPMALLLLSASAPGCVADRRVLEALFRLTPSEARLAVRLAAGRTLDAIASETGVSILTVRAHLRAVFAKVGVNRQAELTAILERLAQVAPFEETSNVR